MKARIYFINHPPFEVRGEKLGTYESGSLTNIKDYSKHDNKVIASIPTSQLLYIEYDDVYPDVVVTVREIEKRPRVG